MRVVFDTSILVSATFWRGNPHRCLLAVEGRLCDLVLSQPTLHEFEEKLVAKFGVPPEEVATIVSRLRSISVIVSCDQPKRWVPDDPKDDVIVETAVAGQVDALVTGDRHILDLGHVEGIPVLTARQFLEKLAQAGAS